MRNVALFLACSLISGGLIAVGCGNSSSTTGTGSGGGASSSTSVGSTTSSTTTTVASSGATTSSTSGGTGGAGGGAGGGTGGTPADPFECTLPATPPSAGSCVTVTGVDGGAAGCNPVTNAGCTGTDVCGPDQNNTSYVCQPAGSPAGLAACGDCSANTATCGVGGLCVGLSASYYVCAQMCCTDADCGSGKCNTGDLQMPLPSGVGLCDAP